MKVSALLASLLTAPVVVVVAAHQTPLHQPQHDASYHTYRSLSSPKHSIRVKQQNDTLCDARTPQYTGWLDVGHKHLFFWYFKSQRDDPHDPLILWQTGGPGGSDMTGMLMENGPCLVNKHGNGTVHNPYGWSREASLLYIDQPAGVGFSYLDKHTHLPATSREAGEDLTKFLEIFISQVFPDKLHAPFHITGESYSGHYTPHLADAILHHNVRTLDDPSGELVHIPLESILMGNPALSFSAIAYGNWETLCTTNPGVPEPIFNETNCDYLAAHTPRCMDLMKTCNERPDWVVCVAAMEYCSDNVEGLYVSDPFGKYGRNRFDITKPCEIPDICYMEAAWLTDYLNLPWVREALAVPKQVPQFNWASEDIARAFYKTVDPETNVDALVAGILAAGVDVLIYQGKLDIACNTAGNRYWASVFKWPGQTAFNAASFQPWAVKGDAVDRSGSNKAPAAGEFKEARVNTAAVGADGSKSKKKTRFTLLTHNNAGHMVPYDQPEQALAMLNAWLAGAAFA